MTPDEALSLVTGLGKESSQALDLARTAAFATQIDATLLRTLRLELFPGSDASAEADLWFSSLVQTRSPKGFVFYPEVGEQLRRALGKQRAAEAWQVVKRCHQGSPFPIQIEEELNYLSLEPETNQQRIRDLLSGALSALLSNPKSGLNGWAGRMLPRLPSALRGLDQSTALGLASDVRLLRPGSIQRRLQGAEALPPWLGQLFVDSSLVRVGVTLTELGLVFEIGGDAEQAFDVPSTDPVVLELRWQEGGRSKSRLVFVAADQPAAPERVPFDELRVVTLKGEIWAIDPDHKAVSELQRVVTVRACSAAYGNLLFWTDEPPESCIGYSIERRTRSGEVAQLEFRSSGSTPSTIFQGTRYFDSEAPRDEVSYRVLPISGSPEAQLVDGARASSWTGWVKAGPDTSRSTWMYFNRGRPRESFRGPDPRRGMTEKERSWLGGDLLVCLRGLVKEAQAIGGHLFGALYDSAPLEVLDELRALGPRGHFVLTASTRFQKKPPESERMRHEHVRALRVAGAEVVQRVSQGLLHNKFFVLTNADEEPLAVSTGNTSLSDDGVLFRQAGCMVTRDATLVRDYLRYWRALQSAGPRLANEPASGGNDAQRVWFSPGAKRRDLEEAFSLIASARDGVVFSASIPDKQLMAVLSNASRHGVYVAGIARGGIAGLDIFEDGKISRIAASAVDSAHKEFWMPVSLRAIAIDPFSDSPILLTGSHGLSDVASRRNEENLLILRGHRQLTQHVAATIENLMASFRFREAVARSSKVGSNRASGWREEVSSAAESPRVRFWLGHVSASATSRASAEPNRRAAPDPRRPAKKTAAKKTAAKKTAAKKTVAKKTVAKKTVAKKTVAKKTVAKKTAAKKTARRTSSRSARRLRKSFKKA